MANPRGPNLNVMAQVGKSTGIITRGTASGKSTVPHKQSGNCDFFHKRQPNHIQVSKRKSWKFSPQQSIPARGTQ